MTATKGEIILVGTQLKSTRVITVSPMLRIHTLVTLMLVALATVNGNLTA